ncbi:MAG TPA: outer membrane protein assembly factor BamD [Acidocella sp.]|nr:outer membrane protein assembly factor BamD [Acidocella sp.]
MTNYRSGIARSALLALALGLAACSSHSVDVDLSGPNLPPADKLYAIGVAQVENGQEDSAVKTFDAVEENYPYSSWVTHAQLMHGYAQYKNQDYDEAIGALNRFIGLHPENAEIAYAYYLKALCYYEQIDDVQRDQTSTYEAIQTLTDVINRFPDSSYARDAKVKLRLTDNRLAGHDIIIGRYYEKQHLYAAAVGRYQDVIQSYQTTTYVPEALERLTEVDLQLGLTKAAQDTASVLAYNYPGSPWYQAAYDKLKAHDLLPAASAADVASGKAAPAPKKSSGFFFGLF